MIIVTIILELSHTRQLSRKCDSSEGRILVDEIYGYLVYKRIALFDEASLYQFNRP